MRLVFEGNLLESAYIASDPLKTCVLLCVVFRAIENILRYLRISL